VVRPSEVLKQSWTGGVRIKVGKRRNVIQGPYMNNWRGAGEKLRKGGARGRKQEKLSFADEICRTCIPEVNRDGRGG